MSAPIGYIIRYNARQTVPLRLVPIIRETALLWVGEHSCDRLPKRRYSLATDAEVAEARRALDADRAASREWHEARDLRRATYARQYEIVARIQNCVDSDRLILLPLDLLEQVDRAIDELPVDELEREDRP